MNAANDLGVSDLDVSLETFAASVNRYLKSDWVPERSGEEALRSTWTELVSLGVTYIGGSDVGGLYGSLCLVRDFGAARCPLPLLDCVVLKAILCAEKVDWWGHISDARVLPVFLHSSSNGGSALGVLNHAGNAIRGFSNLSDGIAATHAVILSQGNAGEWAIGLMELAQPAVHRTVQSAYGQQIVCRFDFVDAQCRLDSIDAPVVADMKLLWRLLLAVRATGALRQALDLAVEHVSVRKQFGVPIGSLQAVQHKLADALIFLDGARLTQDTSARSFDQGLVQWRDEATLAIAVADHALRKSIIEIHHVFGAIGYSEDHPLPQHFRRIHIDLARAGGESARRDAVEALLKESGTQLLQTQLGEPVERFRSELKEWLKENWTAADAAEEDKRAISDRGFSRSFSRKLGAHGLISLTWPPAYGGSGRSRLEQLALIQETTRVSAPCQAHIAAAMLIAPALIAFGNEEQKREFLPPIGKGELTISLGYSEPEAGSDLASMRTRAIADGTDFVISGEKLWGTLTDKADYVWLAARTADSAKKNAGISIFLIPLNLPGITIRPSMAMYGRTFSSQIYDNVRVPGTALVGGLNNGWNVITGALADERILMGSFAANVASLVVTLLRYVAKGLLTADSIGDRMGRLIADVALANALLVRSAVLTANNQPSHVEAAMTKVFSSELTERFSEMALDLAGPMAVLSGDSEGALFNGELEKMLRTGPMQVIGGGANEVQRTLIAQRGLALPR